ncbi:MAG: dUTP diphosphatase [Acidobacteria bacterium]|nr:MAG: dUTP diphosphatase [Acidobacteriota bacterium]
MALDIKIKKLPNFRYDFLPEYQTDGSSGMDLRAAIDKPVELKSLQRLLVPTGLAMAIPPGYEGQIRPRSGLSSKQGITVINAPGTIDSDYRGEVKIPIVNLSSIPVTIQPDMRVAQLVIAPVTKASWIEVREISATERNSGGFGSTGVE